MSATTAYPRIIQGGMGVGVSSWRLANAVSRAGQLGVVSGSMLDTVMVRRLQDGDPGGHIRRAANRFPIPGVADRVIERYYRPSGRPPGTAYQLLPMYRRWVSPARQRVTMLANFVEVWLAKEGHSGAVGINLLTKVQMPNMPSLYGAMLAGAHVVLMGAGIPREIPGVLDTLACHEPTSMRLDVEGDPASSSELLTFDPRRHWAPTMDVRRPRFLPIVSASSLAATLARKASGRVDGFVVEGPTAGGHNAPPRGEARFNADGEPLYGERDLVDLARMRELGLPFWLAGSKASLGAVHAARALGAEGVQVGTMFAYCAESGFTPAIRRAVLAGIARGKARVRTDPRASPTGYPFKIVEVEGMSRQDDTRQRVCDLGYLRSAYRTPTGTLGYRCPAEPVETYVAKGGDAADAVGRRCLCNGLTANIGLPQRRDAGDELPLVTSGDDLASVLTLASATADYAAADVIRHLLADPAQPHHSA